MKNIIVKYKNWKGIIKVISINGEPIDEVLYFDMEHLRDNMADLVELLTGSRVYTLKKCIF